MPPDALVPFLRDHLARVYLIHQDDLARGYGHVYLPYALATKYPNADLSLSQQTTRSRS